MDDLPEAFRTSEAAQSNRAHRAQRNGLRQPTRDRLGEGVGEQRLAPMGSAHDSRAPVHRAAEQIVIAPFDETDVQADPDSQRKSFGRHRIGQRALHRDRRGKALLWIGEGRIHSIAGRLHDGAGVALDGIADDEVVVRQRSRHPIGVLVPQPRAALDVREQDSDSVSGAWRDHASPREIRKLHRTTSNRRTGRISVARPEAVDPNRSSASPAPARPGLIRVDSQGSRRRAVRHKMTALLAVSPWTASPASP